jgi:hypothetical protein
MNLILFYKGISENNLRRPVNKTNNEKELLYTRNTYILKLLFNVVIAGIKTLVSGNKFLYACVKKVDRL